MLIVFPVLWYVLFHLYPSKIPHTSPSGLTIYCVPLCQPSQCIDYASSHDSANNFIGDGQDFYSGYVASLGTTITLTLSNSLQMSYTLNGNTNNLGVFQSMSGYMASYTGGDYCSTIEDNKRTTVYFIEDCAKADSSSTNIEFNEISECVYEVRYYLCFCPEVRPSTSFWVPLGNQLSVPAIKSNGYYIGIAVTSHDNSSPNMAQVKVTNVELNRDCSSGLVTSEQCEQATNCELGLRTNTCYDAGIIKTSKVKIHLPKTEYLHLAEVQVLNDYGVNIALYKPATMSSAFDSESYPAAGVDGLIANSMFHTDIESNPWWQVDLQQPDVSSDIFFSDFGHLRY